VAVPRELRAGALHAIWDSDGAPGHWLTTRTRYRDARLAWERGQGLTTAESFRLCPANGTPWSLGDPGSDERLARLGLAREDLPALRRAARERLPVEARAAPLE